MSRADQVIMAIPDDAASKLWGVDKGPTNVTIHTEDGSDIPQSTLPKSYDYSSNDVTSTVMIDNKTFNVSIVTYDGKVGFTVGMDVIVSLFQLEVGCLLLFTKGFGHFFYLKVFGKNGVEINYPDVDADEAEVPPLDAENEPDEHIDGCVTTFVRMAGEDYFRIPDPVSRKARLDEGLKDLNIRFLHMDPPLQITNGTRREKRPNGRGYRYALTCWKKFMKAARIKMEQAAVTLLNNVDLNVDDYTIRIRIVRLWTRPTFNNPRKIYCYDMIFMDQEGTKMQAFVLQKNTTGYEHLLKENQCLTIRNPSMGENRQKVKYVHTSFKINLNPNTTVQECNEPVGAEWGFDFSPFDSIVDDPLDDSKSFKSPIDVIGFVVKCLPSDDKSDNNNGKDEKKTTFILEDLQHHQIYVTLWGCYADQILDFEKNNKDEKNVVVVVQFGKYRFWGGNMYVSNLYNVTRVLINSEVKEIMDFKKRFIERLSPEISSSYSGLSSPVVKTTRFVVIVGTIKSFASNNEWFYNACTTCNKKVSTTTVVKQKQDGTDGVEEVTVLECKTDVCNTKNVSSVPRIRLYIRVQDCTGIVSLTLFEREVTKLLKVNANQLLDNNIELANEGSFPNELNSLLNMKFAFKIAVSSFNITKKSDGYSVSKMTNNPVVLSELDKHFDTIQPIDEEAFSVEPSDSNRTEDLPVKDSISQTGDDVTPSSNVFKVGFTTSFDQKDADLDTNSERDLKRNLDTVYDVDAVSSQSSSKMRKDGGVDEVILIPNKEA
ncbi:putative nucleic acid-binding, replication factor A [Helianthus annuus]|nr:putative nucleic acid-binding, replication factor A [Helianthus annuus]